MASTLPLLKGESKFGFYLSKIHTKSVAVLTDQYLGYGCPREQLVSQGPRS